MRRFAGMCIGGPKDGELLEHNIQYFRYSIPPKIELSFRYGSVPAMVSVETKEYRHVVLLETGVWLHDNITVAEAVDHIFTTYSKAVRKK